MWNLCLIPQPLANVWPQTSFSALQFSKKRFKQGAILINEWFFSAKISLYAVFIILNINCNDISYDRVGI